MSSSKKELANDHSSALNKDGFLDGLDVLMDGLDILLFINSVDIFSEIILILLSLLSRLVL